MSLLQSKKSIEQYFNDNYSETAIHWAGMNFDTKAYTEWVYFEYVAEYVADSGLDNAEYSQSGTIRCSVVSQSPFRCNEIADMIIELFKAKKIDALFAGKIKVLSQDYVADIDKTIMELDLYMTTF